MKIITRTGFGCLRQTELLIGKPYKALPNSTLNEKFEVQANVLPEAGKIPYLGYYCIGQGGHRNEVGADGFPLTSPIDHRPTDAGLFRYLPFVLRELTNDLDSAARSRYAMRKIIQVDGRNYVAYYLKKIPMDSVNPDIYYNRVVDGQVTTTPFRPDNSNLNPPPPEIPNTGTVTTSADYLSVSAILPMDFTANDVAELVNAVRILYKDERYAVISEIGMVTAATKLVTGPGPGNTTIQYEEAVAAQIAAHMTGHYPVGFTNMGFSLKVNLGATEPMFKPSAVTTGN